MNIYEKLCFEHIKDTLPDYIGQDIEICDLGMMLTEGENANGSWYCLTYKAEQDLDKFGRSVVGDFIDEYKREFGEAPQWDSYADPEQFHCLMMIMGVERLFNQSDTVQKYWNQNIKLTKRIVNQIIDDIEREL